MNYIVITIIIIILSPGPSGPACSNYSQNIGPIEYVQAKLLSCHILWFNIPILSPKALPHSMYRDRPDKSIIFLGTSRAAEVELLSDEPPL